MTPAQAVKKYTLDSTDESAARLTLDLRTHRPFVFVRYGDGAIEAMYGTRAGHTCDREEYTIELGEALFEAWRILTGAKRCYAGDWLASRFPHPQHPSRYETQFDDLLSRAAARPILIHPEALLLNRASEQLLTFYRTLRDRSVLYVGPLACRGAAEALGAQFVESPMSSDLLSHIPSLVEACQARTWNVLLWGCGMAGSVLAAKLYEEWPERTYINTGSAFDALYRQGSRSGQITPKRAREFFKGVLC